MSEVREFLIANPREVVTVIWELFAGDPSGALKRQLTATVGDLGLTQLLHEQALGEPWPTLGQMVESGKRLVFFTPTRGGACVQPRRFATVCRRCDAVLQCANSALGLKRPQRVSTHCAQVCGCTGTEAWDLAAPDFIDETPYSARSR